VSGRIGKTVEGSGRKEYGVVVAKNRRCILCLCDTERTMYVQTGPAEAVWGKIAV
jgi:hypothetical protein